MENFFIRYKNPLVLMAVLFIQVIALATQVKRPENPKVSNSGGTRLIRVWTVTAFTPIERLFVFTGHFFRSTWHNYVDLHDVRKQNRELQDKVARLQMEQVRLKEDALQARRLHALLGFKERFIAQTVAAQVIGSSGSEQSRVIYIDKGSRDGIRPDMAVITPDGIVGKVKDVFPLSSQVMLINDHDSGAGVILERSRLQGVLKGSGLGELQVGDIMSDEKVEGGDQVVTSGGDRIYPKGLPVGTVSSAAPDRDNDPFLAIKIKPAADLDRLEEVLVVTKMAEETPAAATVPIPLRAADILAQRLPSVPKQPQAVDKASGSSRKTPAPGAPGATPGIKKPANPGGEKKKEGGPVAGQTKSTAVSAGAADTTQGASPKSGPEQKKAVSTDQKKTPAASGAAASPTPTPTPKPKQAKKPKPPANATDAAAPNAPDTKKPDSPDGAAPPATSPEKPPR